MGHAYEQLLLPDRHSLLFQMQAYAISEPEIRVHVRDGFKELVRTVAELGGRLGRRDLGLLRLRHAAQRHRRARRSRAKAWE